MVDSAMTLVGRLEQPMVLFIKNGNVPAGCLKSSVAYVIYSGNAIRHSLTLLLRILIFDRLRQSFTDFRKESHVGVWQKMTGNILIFEIGNF